MPKQASVSRRPIPPSSPSIRAAVSRRSRSASARSWSLRSSTTLAALLLAATACRSLRLATSDARIGLRASLIRIEDTRHVELPPLDSALGSADPTLRRATALRALATDADARVAAAALYALGLLDDSASVPVATAALRSGAETATEAAWMLGEVGEAGRSALIGAATDVTLGARRGLALLALARVKGVPAA